MKFILPDKVYDILVWVAQYLIPALGTLYFAIARIWGIPFGEEILGTLTALDTFFGVILGISTANWDKARKTQQVPVETDDFNCEEEL